MGTPAGNTKFLELVHQLEQFASGGVVRHAPQRSLWWVGNNSCRLGINQLVEVLQTQILDLLLVVTVVDVLDRCSHGAVVAGDHGVFQAQVDIPFLGNSSLEEAMCPGFNVLQVIGCQQPGIALANLSAMQLYRVSTTPDKHQLDHTGCHG